MRRNPGFTLVVLSTLAIGIGANTVMFSIVNTLLLRPLPYRDPGQLVFVQAVDATNRELSPTAPPDFYAYRAQNRTLDASRGVLFPVLQPDGRPRGRAYLDADRVGGNLHGTRHGARATAAAFVSQEEQWGSHRVVMLTDGLWQRRFGGDPRVLGQPITLNGEPYEIVGILPPGFSFMGFDVQLFVPMAFDSGDNMNSHSNYFLRMIGRLKPGVSRQQASGDLNAISERNHRGAVGQPGNRDRGRRRCATWWWAATSAAPCSCCSARSRSSC